MGKALTSKSVGTGLSTYEKRIYRTVVSQRLRNTALRRGPQISPVPGTFSSEFKRSAHTSTHLCLRQEFVRLRYSDNVKGYCGLGSGSVCNSRYPQVPAFYRKSSPHIQLPLAWVSSILTMEAVRCSEMLVPNTSQETAIFEFTAVRTSHFKAVTFLTSIPNLNTLLQCISRLVECVSAILNGNSLLWYFF